MYSQWKYSSGLSSHPNRAGDRQPVHGGKLARRAQQLSTDRYQHAGAKQPVDLLNHPLAGICERRRAGHLDHRDPACGQHVITTEVAFDRGAFGFLDDELD